MKTSLSYSLSQEYVDSGEILSLDKTAQFFTAWEKENGPLSPLEIFQATWEAADLFVNSMQDNSPDDAAKWENFRPSVARKAEILKLLSL